MELVCFKYNEKMDQEDAQCRHPADYCKFRTSCIIHFMGLERKENHDSGEKVAESEAGEEGGR